MKLFRLSIAPASLVLLVVQLALVSSLAATYAWQRYKYPLVWTRAYGYDPELPLRGRYLSLQVGVDGCLSTLPSSRQAMFPRDYTGAIKPGPYAVKPSERVEFQAQLKVEKDKLEAVYIVDEDSRHSGQRVTAVPGEPCDRMLLAEPVDFFIADNARSVLSLAPGQELWIEVTVPPQGPPRPLQLAVKDNSSWRPLDLR
jgi:hypothetical protein